jgi:hypothetical protein
VPCFQTGHSQPPIIWHINSAEHILKLFMFYTEYLQKLEIEFSHSTIQQCHRIVNKIKESMEGKKVCTSVFLDIQQAFDKVWHKRLLYKLKKNLSDQLYLIMKSYLSEHYFQVKIDDELSAYHLI